MFLPDISVLALDIRANSVSNSSSEKALGRLGAAVRF
jgi:hypothetical protein